MNEKKENKTWKIVKLGIAAIVLVAFIVCIILEIVSPNSSFSDWMKNNVWDVSATLTILNTQVPTIIHCIIYIVLVLVICKIVRTIFAKQMQKSNKIKTTITIFDGLVKYGCAIAVIFFVLKACGVNTTALWASAGILALIIGLGAQSLIADIIAGIFIIFENEYEVGEIVTIDDFRGTVIEIGIRATKLLDTAGNIKIINNSDVSNVVNMSRELSLAAVECEFPYDVPIEYIEKILKEALPEIKEKIPAIVEGPFYKGVSQYEASNVAVKLVAKCKEEDRYQVQRDLLREYRVVFVEHGIDLSYDQVVINQPSKQEIKVSKSDKRQANEFVDEQKAASTGLDEQQK